MSGGSEVAGGTHRSRMKGTLQPLGTFFWRGVGGGGALPGINPILPQVMPRLSKRRFFLGGGGGGGWWVQDAGGGGGCDCFVGCLGFPNFVVLFCGFFEVC